jgi:hypothetical protein
MLDHGNQTIYHGNHTGNHTDLHGNHTAHYGNHTALHGHTGSHGGSIFGIAFTLDSNIGTYEFIAFVIGLIFLEFVIENLEIMAERRGLVPLFQKLQKELMMMGIISFTVFIYRTAANPPEGDISLEAIEMTDVIMLFMALAFIIQASFIVLYATIAGKKYLTVMRTESAALVESYRALDLNPRMSWWFHHGPSWLPGTCPLRTNIETRIIERLFVSQHKLPPEFNFAQYISILFEVRGRLDLFVQKILLR